MQLNLPILHRLEDCESILIAGAGGGFDVFAGLPIYYTLHEMGKGVHLANYSFTDLPITRVISDPEVLTESLFGARGRVKKDFQYYPEGYLAQWFWLEHADDVAVWMFEKTGVLPLQKNYEKLMAHLGGVDAIIMIDGGVDSLMRGDETGAGTMLEDSITLAAVDALDVPVKLMVSVGFGTEVEESVCHYHALENMAALAKMGAFLGSCALTPQMEAFQFYEAACRYVWEQPTGHHRSHISTRIIPAVNGEFGNYRMYDDSRLSPHLLSPLMSLYWFFEADAVVQRNLIIDTIRQTETFHEALKIVMRLREKLNARPRKQLPY
ncbi:MAG: DUF1152 domain-containing protein [Chloroflexi bacterium]|nr:MAG: DUF1152 domain-containing protein [Chloroflexota bacterium]